MLEIYTGNTGHINITTNDSQGFPASPDFGLPPTIKLINPETNQTVVQSSGTIIDIDYPGEYEYLIPSQYLQADAVFKIEWTYNIDGYPVIETDYLYITTPYATIDEISEELGFSMRSEDPNYERYEKIQSAERLAKMLIDNELGFSLGKKSTTVTAYGSGADVLVLPSRIISISSLKENGELVIDTNYNIFGYNVEITETNYGIRIIPTNPGDDIDEQEQFDFTGLNKGQFRDGYRYEVTGIFGWSYIPQEIKQCMFLLINDILCNENTWRSKYVKKINNGQMSVELSSLAYTGTGNALVDSILQKFKMIQAVVI